MFMSWSYPRRESPSAFFSFYIRFPEPCSFSQRSVSVNAILVSAAKTLTAAAVAADKCGVQLQFYIYAPAFLFIRAQDCSGRHLYIIRVIRPLLAHNGPFGCYLASPDSVSIHPVRRRPRLQPVRHRLWNWRRGSEKVRSEGGRGGRPKQVGGVIKNTKNHGMTAEEGMRRPKGLR